MSGLITAIGLSTAAGLAGSLASGAMQSGAAKSGQQGAQRAAIWGWQEGAPYYQAAQDYMAPYTQLSNDAIWQIQNWLGNKGNINTASGAFWKPPNMKTAAQAGGLDYGLMATPLWSGQLKKMTGYSPTEAFAPITMKGLSDFTGLNSKKTLKGYNPQDVQRLSGVDLSGLFNSVGSVGIQNPKPRQQQQGLKPAQQANFDKLHGLAQQGKMNPTQQANYLRLVRLQQG